MTPVPDDQDELHRVRHRGARRLDAVTCLLGVVHVPDQAAALAEMRRVLKPAVRAMLVTAAAA